MEKRREKNGKKRILRTGEQQRSDGRYMYSYVDMFGKRQYVYSWTLEPTDVTPIGKKRGPSLRELEKKIKKDLEDGVCIDRREMTVMELVEKYLSQKRSVKHSTRANYKTVVNTLRKEMFSSKKIDKVCQFDAKTFLIELQESGKRYSSIHNIRGVLRPAFKMAVDNDWIRKNPFDFPLSDAVINDMITREALSRADQKRFLKFIEEDNHYHIYYDAIFILLNTGIRISEWTGITLNDIDLKEKKLVINHQLQRTREMQYYVTDTKTNAGTRILPLSDEVCAAFERIIEARPNYKEEPVIEGEDGKKYTRFLYYDKNGMPLVAQHWEKHIQLAVLKHNKIYKQELPEITPHILRHTYCTNMARSGMNPKTLQYLMGHSEVGVTLNVYTHIKYDDAKEDCERFYNEINGKLKSNNNTAE